MISNRRRPLSFTCATSMAFSAHAAPRYSAVGRLNGILSDGGGRDADTQCREFPLRKSFPAVGRLAFPPSPPSPPRERARVAFASIGVHKKRAILLSLLTTHVGKKEIKKGREGRKEGSSSRVKTFKKVEQGGFSSCTSSLGKRTSPGITKQMVTLKMNRKLRCELHESLDQPFKYAHSLGQVSKTE